VFATLELLAHRAEQALKIIVVSKGEGNAGIGKLREECEARGIPVVVNDSVVERLSPRESHLAVGVFRKYETHLSAGSNQVVLVQPADMGNLGTIIRTMVGFGLTDLALIRPAADLFDPRVIRASMGAIFQISFQYFDDFDQYQADFRHHLYPLMTDGRQPIGTVAFTRPYALIFGSEASGLRAEFQAVGTSIRIPHTEDIDSLNLSVAVGIALFAAAQVQSGQ
jgi:TrmH family RNA methyltransferase